MSHSNEFNDQDGPHQDRPHRPHRSHRPQRDGLTQDGMAGLLLPLALGLVVSLLTYLVMFAVVLAIALARFDYSHSFGTGDALAIGLQGALALGLACALGAWLSRRRAQLRDVSPSLARRVGLLTGLILTLVLLLIGIVPALRLITAPIYLLSAVIGTAAGAGFGTAGRSWFSRA